MFLFDQWIIWRKKAYNFGLDARVNTASCEKALWVGEKCRMVLSNWFGSARQRLKGMTSKTVDFRYVLLEYSDVFAQTGLSSPNRSRTARNRTFYARFVD